MKRANFFRVMSLPLAMFMLNCGDNSTANNNDGNDSNKVVKAEKVDEALSFKAVDTRAYYYLCAEDNYYDFSVRAYSVAVEDESYPYDEVLISIQQDKAVTTGEYTMPNDANSGYYVTFDRYLDDSEESDLELLSYTGSVSLTKMERNGVEVSIKDIRLKEFSFRNGVQDEIIFNYLDDSKIYSIPNLTITVDELFISDCADELEDDDDYL